MPTSATASSPARRICSSSSRMDRSWTSSMRAGWMRPSSTSFARVMRAASRRTGSKHLRTTASGVSSMMRFTPVVASNARMLRPSRPMMRPFMSSLGRANTLTVDSAVCSEATRWIAIVTILRARSSPSSRARCSISRTWVMAARLASSTTWVTSWSLASLEVMPAIFSSWARWSSVARSSCVRTYVSFSSRSSSSPARASAARRLGLQTRSRPRSCAAPDARSRRAGPQVVLGLPSHRGSRSRPSLRCSVCCAAASASRSASSSSFWARASMLCAFDAPHRTSGTGSPPRSRAASPAMPVNTGIMVPPEPRQTTFARRTLRSAFVQSDAVRE